MNENILLCWDATHYGLRTLSRVLDNLTFKQNVDISKVYYLYCEYMFESNKKDEAGYLTKDRINFLENISTYSYDENKAEFIHNLFLEKIEEKEEKNFEHKRRVPLNKYYQSSLARFHSSIKFVPVIIPKAYIKEESGDSYIEIQNAIESVVLPKIVKTNPKTLNISLNSGTFAMKTTWITLHSQSVFNAYVGNCVKLWAFPDEAFKSDGRRNRECEELQEQKIIQNPYITLIENSKFEEENIGTLNLDITGLIKKTATINAPILLLGEKGTGKSFIVHDIYETKIQANILKENAPLKEIVCGSLSGNLVDDKLFGHWKGAFTGAEDDVPGAFEECNGGLLFLDEIQDIPKETQRKILRALNEHKITRQGHPSKKSAIQEEIEVNFQLVCASNKTLKELQQSDKLDPDFFDRIARFICEMKPLRTFDENLLRKIWNIRWMASIYQDKLCLPKDPDSFDLVKDTLIESQMLGNIRDINQLIAYIARDVYEGVPVPTKNKMQEKYPLVLKEWKDDYNNKYSSSIFPDETTSRKMLEEYGWSGMEKLFKSWLAEYAVRIYGTESTAATKMNACSKTLKESRKIKVQ